MNNKLTIPHQENETLRESAIQNISDTLTQALEHTSGEKALVIYDTNYPLTILLADAYREALPDAVFRNFNEHTKEALIEEISLLKPHDLVVLIQTTDFRLNQFRFRIYLFQHKLKVIEHQNLHRHTDDTWETYINSLAYDRQWYRGMGTLLKDTLSEAQSLTLKSDTHTLRVNGPLEIPKLNVGDYRELENKGGTFPIGEVFTEAKKLEDMDGSILIYAFAGTDYRIAMHNPFSVTIRKGLLVEWDETAPESFNEIMQTLSAQERPFVREIGFGLNRAITREHYVYDITAFERMYGMHLSVGEKHTVYKKTGITADKTRFHVDLFPVVDVAETDKTVIFKDGVYAF